jgi:hypothetical protein
MEAEQKKISHTPGPWTLSMGYGAGRQILAVLGDNKRHRDFVEFVLRGDVPVPIFTDVWVQFPSEEWGQMQDANAKLIAAAPCLLEALKRIVADFKDYPASERPCYAFDKAVEAIKKATE